MSEDWARQLANKIHASQEEQRQERDLELQRRTILKEQVPAIWDLLQNEIKSNAKQVNQYHSKSTPYFRVSDPPTREGLSFHVESPRRKFEVVLLQPLNLISVYELVSKDPLREPKKETKETFHFAPENGEVWLQTGEDEKLSVPSAAKRILELLA